MEDKADVFRCLVEGQDLQISEEFFFQTLFFKSSYSYRCCPCAFQYEFFQYLSDEGALEQQMLENIVKYIRNKECDHIEGVSSEFIAETSVSARHVFAAVHRSDFKNSFYHLKSIYESQVRNRQVGIFKLTEYDIAVLKNNNALLEYYNDAETNHELFIRKFYYDLRTLIMTPGILKSEIQIESVPTLEHCVKIRNPKMLRCVLGSRLLSVEQSHMTPLYELVVRNHLEEMEQILKARDIKFFEEMRNAGDDERISWAEPAIVYNRPDLLEEALSLLMDIHEDMGYRFKQNLMEASFVLQRRECQRVLSKHKLPDTNPCRLEISDQIHCLLYLYENYRYLRTEIGEKLNNIPDIGKIVNIPWRCKHHPHNVLTHLQIYLFYSCHELDLEVVKLLLKLGAHTEGDPRNGDMYFRPLIHCLVNPEQYRGYLRPLLELLLFANSPTKLDDRHQCLGLKADVLEYKADTRSTVRTDLIPGRYITDGKQHTVSASRDPACRFVVPLLIEAGFQYPPAELEGMLDKVEEKGIHPDEKLYLKSCLNHPRPLTHCCRNVLRKSYPGHQIHEFVRAVAVPKTIKDFILLKPVLPFVQSFEL